MAAGAVAHVGPAFQEDAATAVPPRCRISHYLVRRSAFMHNIEAAFKTNEILPHRPIFARQLRQRLSSLTRPAHQFFPRRRRVTDSAFSFGGRHGRQRRERLVHRVELRAALAADGEDDLFHSNENQRADCNGSLLEFSLRIREAEENSGGTFSRMDEQWSGLSESNRHLNLGKSAGNGASTTYEALSGALSSI